MSLVAKKYLARLDISEQFAGSLNIMRVAQCDNQIDW